MADVKKYFFNETGAATKDAKAAKATIEINSKRGTFKVIVRDVTPEAIDAVELELTKWLSIRANMAIAPDGSDVKVGNGNDYFRVECPACSITDDQITVVGEAWVAWTNKIGVTPAASSQSAPAAQQPAPQPKKPTTKASQPQPAPAPQPTKAQQPQPAPAPAPAPAQPAPAPQPTKAQQPAPAPQPAPAAPAPAPAPATQQQPAAPASTGGHFWDLTTDQLHEYVDKRIDELKKQAG